MECHSHSRTSLKLKSSWLTQNELNSIFVDFHFVLFEDFFVLMDFCLLALVLILVFLFVSCLVGLVF